MHAQTPRLTVSDPRGLAVRSVDYCRVMSGAAAEVRINHARFDAHGRLLEQRDPRLWRLPQAPANLATVHSLSGQVLGRDGVDNGWRRSLPGEAGQLVRQWDERGSQRRMEYDGLLRPLAVFEQLADQSELCSERLTYAEGSDEHSLRNRCGRLSRHDDPAGKRCWPDYSLTGEASSEQRHFLASPDWPDWPVAVAARDARLEAGEGAATRWRHGPLGQVLTQTDAGGHRQSFHSNLSGELQQVRLQLAGQPEQTLLSQARYDALGQMLEETLGNGLTTQRTYGDEDGHLLSLMTLRSNGEALQDIHYGYDPVGNVTSVEDHAQPLRHFANQRIEPRCAYRYDSLYQLTEATGWEAGAASRGPGVSSDPLARSNYRQTYRYDAGGNLLELTHVGAQSHSRTLVSAPGSNRCLEVVDGQPPGDDAFRDGFDANGNRLALQPGQRLRWNVRNQLSEVRPVTREGATDDSERYHYDAAGQRVRKLRSAQAAGRNLHSETRYLPGLELHDNAATGEQLQVITVQAGSCGVRVLHWLAGRPDEVAQDQQRYGLTDHLGSNALELDERAALISHEVYYPFGETAWRAGRSEVEAGYKTLRYSGKERDATGLYYYGARYYMPWLQRWLNPDPAGAMDGLNLYCMVGNSPVRYRDRTGLQGDEAQGVEPGLLAAGDKLIASGLQNFPSHWRQETHAAVRLGIQWAGAARAALQGRGDQDYLNAAIRSAFGRSAPETTEGQMQLRARLSSKLRRGADFLDGLQKADGWRLMLVESTDPHRYGATHTSSQGTRLSLSPLALEAGVLNVAATLFHESLHAMDRRANKPATTHEVRDYRYLVPAPIDTYLENHLEQGLHLTFTLAAAESPLEQQMSSLNKTLYAGLINRVAARLGLPPATSAETRSQYFQQIALVHREVELHNADFLAGFAMLFDRFVR
ncbi:MAG: RHS repeat domain-containing protein [Pseudomonas sp.]|uniref:RHS repeat domain-containing protein n=1 Tax=Pseudomonas sp. TaxID=306 RepID=UPI003D0FF50A